MRRDDRDDRDDPFEDLFRQLERMMNEMVGEGNVDVEGVSPGGTDFGGDTHVDVHRTDDDVRVVADLPGIEKEAIDLTCDGEVLTISAGSEHRDYEERVSLPVRVDEHSATATYNNGVLEVVFDPLEDSADIDLS
ncbi:Hsp20/alpha crystallin family protein [Halobacteriales archaeon SW_7_71_33]|jgi:HSP20 family protein|nr:MAG: Hsp20/alpha crystallin family protein [Halobacteriales archaeon SW_12_71_31]PSQ59496.1 MAG: Hsp20/alpha crystallin family protein [Halobacteriales archaeon SW_7_71_33]